MNELISVIVPCYNIESFICNTVQSILNQSYLDLEIILVDDGSKDGTLAALHQIASTDERIKVIHKENGGVTSARLAGVEAAKGEWIGFVDGDDYIEPDMYEHLLNNAHRYHADISHCGYQMVFPSRVDYYHNKGTLIIQDNLSGLKDLLLGEIVEPGLWNKLFYRSLFVELFRGNLMDTSIRINEDLLMNYYLFKQAGKSIYEDFCPYHYMVRKGSAATSNINENKLKDPLRVQQIIKKDVHGQQELEKVINGRMASILISMATMSLGSRRELIAPYRKNARKELSNLLPELLRGSCSKRMKFLSVWASIWPASYRWVHTLYAHLCGTDRKYEVS